MVLGLSMQMAGWWCVVCVASAIHLKPTEEERGVSVWRTSMILHFWISLYPFKNLLYGDVTSTRRDSWRIRLCAILANFSLCCGCCCCCCCAAICWNLTAMKRREWTGFHRSLSHSTMLYHYQTDIANDSCRATIVARFVSHFSSCVYCLAGGRIMNSNPFILMNLWHASDALHSSYPCGKCHEMLVGFGSRVFSWLYT